MGKKRLGQSVVNWHRSLGSNELSRRHQRQMRAEFKHTVPSHALCEAATDDLIEERYHRQFAQYNEYSQYGYYRYDSALNHYYHESPYEADKSDIYAYQISSLIDSIVTPRGLKLSSDMLARLELFDSEECEIPDSPLIAQTDNTNLEDRLASYLSLLDSIDSASDLLRQLISDAMGDGSEQSVIEQALEPELVEFVCLFSPFWIRSPRSWKQSTGDTLIEHLFACYPVPTFLNRAWYCEIRPVAFKRICWYIIIGQGGSLRRAAKRFQWIVPAKLPHYFHETSLNLSFNEATVYAAIRSMGGTENDFVRFARQPAYIIDITSPEHNGALRKFWHDTVRWMIKHGTSITDDDSGQILNWAMHRYTESLRTVDNPFSWKKRGVRSTLEQSREYHERISRYQSRDTWSGHGWDWTWIDDRETRWDFVELTSGTELYDDGRDMNHCVSTYASMCANGFSAIVSLRKNYIRRVTIEVRPISLNIVQARGHSNRRASEQEELVISLWHKRITETSVEAIEPDDP